MTREKRFTAHRRGLAALAVAGLAFTGAFATAEPAEAATRGQSVYAETLSSCQSKMAAGILGAGAAGRDVVYVNHCKKNTRTAAGWNNYVGSFHWRV